MTQSLPVIVNASAGLGHGAAEFDRLTAAFAAAGAEARLLPARNGDELRDIARREAQLRPPVIVAGGGDGTINAVASELLDSDTALGVLPLGTLNHFARDAGIPSDLDEAVRVILARRVKRVDVGEVNGRVFLNNSSIGLYPSMVRHRVKQQQRLGRGKWHAMFWASLTVLRRSPFLRVSLEMDGQRDGQRDEPQDGRRDGAPRELRTPFIFIGNNEYLMEGFRIGQRERLDAGLLSVYTARTGGRWALLRLAMRALLGSLHQDREFEAGKARTLHIGTRHRRLLVATDGEVAPVEGALHYRSRAGALRVIVAAPATMATAE
jgi:diacylglycerol kinase family enzyme